MKGFTKILKYIHPKNMEGKLQKFFDLVLAIVTTLVVFFAVVKCGIYHMCFYENGRKIVTKLFVLKNNLLHQETFDKIASRLAIYDAKIKESPLKFIRLGGDNDGGYVVPSQVLEASEALMGYGISDDISFEREFSQRFNKPSYGFDCGVQNIETGDSRCHFFSECIGTSDYLYENQISSGRVSFFSDQLQRLGLKNKKIFIKMDIEGAEFEVLYDILNHSDNVTGIVFEFHMTPCGTPKKALQILSSLDRHFVLVHLHGTNVTFDCFKSKNAKNYIPTVLELTYVNKKLLSSYEISKNQKHPQPIDQPNHVNLSDYKFEIIPNSL